MVGVPRPTANISKWTRPSSSTRSPRGQTYLDLLRYASETQSAFSLVWTEQNDYDLNAGTLLEMLAPDLLSEKRTDEWPGTRRARA
jgi:hypothetical protein